MDENDKTIAENSDKAKVVSSAIFKNAARRSVIKGTNAGLSKWKKY